MEKCHSHCADEHQHIKFKHEHYTFHSLIFRFWIALIITVPILILSPMPQMFFGYKLNFHGEAYLSWFLATLVFLYGGWPFLAGLISECKARTPGKMTLIGIAISIAYFYSSAVAFGSKGNSFFWELVILIDIILLGHWLEIDAVQKAFKPVATLEALLPKIVHLKHDNLINDIELAELKNENIVVVKPGEVIPADGVVVTGNSYVDESLLTGESIPHKKLVNDKVVGGTINQDGTLEVLIKHTGEKSFIAKLIQLVHQAQQDKTKTQRLVDRAATWLTFSTIGIAIITLLVWLNLSGDLGAAIERMLTVMVISSPYALALAIPLVVASSIALAAQHGLLIRNRTAFANARKISAVIFNKTGTLTTGIFGIRKIISLHPTYSENDILSMAAAIEQYSEHHLGKCIVVKAMQNNLALPAIQDFHNIPGEGVSAFINAQHCAVVGPHYLLANNIYYPEKLLTHVNATDLFVLCNNEIIGIIMLADCIKDNAAASIKQLQQQGIKVIMTTGDNKIIAASIAEELGLDDFYAEIAPQQKLEIVKTLQKQGECVAMAGDGTNDAPALTQADIGIAIGAGAGAAETADIILASNDPKDIVALINFGKKTYRKMQQNIWWALGYNIIAIPLAAGILSHFGIILNPAVGAILMSLSTIVVAINAALLKN